MPEHTIAENLTRLQNAKTAIGNAITNAGGTVSQGDGLEEFAADVGTIIPPINTVVEAANTSLEASLGSGSSALITKSVTANGEYTATDDNALGYSSVSVNVANSYSQADNGKVVSNQALVAQTACPTEITENDTYDTTNYNSITVNVAGGTDFGFSSIPTFNSDGTSISCCCYNSIDGNGTFNVTFGVTSTQQGSNFGFYAILCQPAKKVNISYQFVYEGTIVFTPAEDFDGFYDEGGKITLTGDGIIAGDGKVYELSYNAPQESFVIKAFGNNCTVNE